MSDTKYTGKVVLLERAEPTSAHSSHYDGSYLVWAETPNQLFAHSSELTVWGLGGALAGHQFPLAGQAAYNVVSVDEPAPWMFEALDRVEEEIQAVRSGEKKAQWTGSVYDKAESAVHRLRTIWAPKPGVVSECAEEAACSDAAATVSVTVPRGVQVTVSYCTHELAWR